VALSHCLVAQLMRSAEEQRLLPLTGGDRDALVDSIMDDLGGRPHGFLGGEWAKWTYKEGEKRTLTLSGDSGHALREQSLTGGLHRLTGDMAANRKGRDEAAFPP
jgi:hypothetical protein